MRVVLSCLAVLVGASAAGAETITVTDSSRGRFSSSGIKFTASSNYYTSISSGVHYRNYFVFDVPELAGSIITAVTLRVFTGSVEGGSDLPVVFTSTGRTLAQLGGDSLDNFNALGTGTLFGSRVYNSSDANADRDIVFNSAGVGAVDAARNGQIIISARMDLPLGGTTRSVYGSTNSHSLRLILDYEDAPPPGPPLVPLPSTAALAGAGLVAGMGRRRR